ncbi:HmuY family protein [Chitinophaga japonensis]|uniref:Heme-binding HmuY-like protein n=1 Tax=Chitinophaga japonensis TaxID=104662 RepID=A0A562TCP6_CHIJA|nr:HmuY family protein [Chitinophaga japonensis]TWI91048.1 hypothetical protein LX66_0409 [Chitinophaga japonensis]
MNTIKQYYAIAWIGMSAAVFTACSKSDDEPVTPVDPPGEEVVTGVYTVSDLAADTSATSSGAATTLYYSLARNQVVPASQVQTNNWDIAFTGIYNSSVYVNNGQSQYSPGYGGPGRGAIALAMYADIEAQYYDAAGHRLASIPVRTLFDQAFDRVTTAVADDAFNGYPSVELDYFLGTGDGWAWYDFYGVLYPGRADKAHVAYALPRPLIVRTAKGNYAKVVIYSLYKGAPVDPDRSHKPGYISFKYAIQQDGSRNLDIR